MYDEFKEWVQSVLPTYTFTQGQWVEAPDNAKKFIASIHHSGGPPVAVEVRKPRFRVLLLGPRGDRYQAQVVRQNMEALIVASMGDSVPCGAASIQTTSEPTGPGYTTEDRVFVYADFQLIF